jgi:cytochrome P450
VPLLVKTAREPLQVGHDVVEAGSIVILNFYGLQRHARWWRAPDQFDPDRFAANSGEPAHQYAFVPFNSGPRVCIGASFAMLELIIVLATLLQHLRFSAIPDTARAPELRISLRPHSDMTVQVRER